MHFAVRPSGQRLRIGFVAFDLDGTLIDSTERHSSELPRILDLLRERGLSSILVTGRSAPSLRQSTHLSQLLSRMHDEILISEGNACFSWSLQRLVRHRLVCSADLVRRLTMLPGAEIVVEYEGELYASSRRAAIQMAMAYRLPRVLIQTIGSAIREFPCATTITVFNAQSIASAIAGVDCCTFQIDPFNAWVVRPAGTSKASALAEHLRRTFGEPDLTRTIAFGDGTSDCTMLSECRVGVATANACDAARAAADHSLNEDLESYLRDLRIEEWSAP